MLHETPITAPLASGSPHTRPPIQKLDSVSYRHILVPTGMTPGERSAVRLGLQMAAVHQAKVTFLHVLTPTPPPPSVHWLDAIDNLWDGLSRSTAAMPRTRAIATLETSHREICEFLRREGSLAVEESPQVRVECRSGDIASEILRFADATEVDVVILCCELPSTWPSWPSQRVRQLLQTTQKQVILVRPAD